MIQRRSFPREVESVPVARHFVAEAISSAPRDVGERVAVMVSELATNAILHGQTEFHVRVQVDDNQICVEITDGGLGEPTPRVAASSDLSGRGLRIVEVLSDNWGVRPAATGIGKSVWFVVDVPVSV